MVSNFDVETGNHISEKDPSLVSWSEIISNYMIDYANKQPKFHVVVPAMITGGGLLSFQKAHPTRISDVGIAEQMAVTMSSGLALSGVDVFCPIYSTFIQRAYDQVNHDVARQHLKVVFGLDRAGIVGADGETHQGVFDIPLLRHIPHMTIAHPYTPQEAFELLNYAYNVNTGPFVLRYERGSVPFDVNQPITTDIASLNWTVLQKGTDIIFVSFGSILDPVIDAANKENISMHVVNARFIKPLDTAMIDQLIAMNKPIIIYEESALLGGFGSSIIEYLVESKQDTSNIIRMGIPDEYVQHGTKQELLRELNLDVKSIISVAKEHIHH